MDAARPSRWTIRSTLEVSYEVRETRGLLDPECSELARVPHGQVIDEPRLVVLDDRVADIYGHRVRRYFETREVSVNYLTVPAVEARKSMDVVLLVAARLNDLGTNRLSSPPVVIGGGVVADVVGLAASLYRRGIPYVRVPTTLLSQVDVSVAAKTGVNFGGYRNRLGSYAPPPITLIDREFLRSLPARHVRNGMGEILKMALVADRRLFELLESHGDELVRSRLQDDRRGAGPTVADEVISRAIEGMVGQLAPNLWEKDLRRLVDYGHTFSPLIEMTALPELLHGEAVAIDCIFSALLSAHRGLLSWAEVGRLIGVARSLGLQVSHPLFCDVDVVTRALADTQRHRDGRQNLPLLTTIGAATFADDISGFELGIACRSMSELLDGPAVDQNAGKAV